MRGKGQRTKDQGPRDKGQGTRDKGQGTRDKGQRTRDTITKLHFDRSVSECSEVEERHGPVARVPPPESPGSHNYRVDLGRAAVP